MKQKIAKQEPLGYIDLTRDVLFKRYFAKNNLVLFLLIKNLLWISDKASHLSLSNPNILATASDTINQHNLSDDRLSLQDSSIPPDILGGKQIVLDLRAKLDNGENVNIEMQNYFEEHFLTRMYFYLTQLHSQQLRRGDKYDKVMPSHLLVFTTFDVLDGEDYIVRITPTAHGHPEQKVGRDLELVIVRLNKFNKSLDELVDMIDRWCYIIKHSAQLTAEQVKYLSQDRETRMVLEHLAEMSKEDKARWEAISLARREWEEQLKREGLEEKGRVKGLQEGRVQGMEAGKVERDREIALSMLQKGLDVSLISEVTGLSVAEVEQLNGRTTD